MKFITLKYSYDLGSLSSLWKNIDETIESIKDVIKIGLEEEKPENLNKLVVSREIEIIPQ